MKKAYSIEWHRECLNNFKETLAYNKKELQRLADTVARQEAEVKFRESQIESAVIKKKTEFDGDKFLGGFKYPPPAMKLD